MIKSYLATKDIDIRDTDGITVEVKKDEIIKVSERLVEGIIFLTPTDDWKTLETGLTVETTGNAVVKSYQLGELEGNKFIRASIAVTGTIPADSVINAYLCVPGTDTVVANKLVENITITDDTIVVDFKLNRQFSGHSIKLSFGLPVAVGSTYDVDFTVDVIDDPALSHYVDDSAGDDKYIYAPDSIDFV